MAGAKNIQDIYSVGSENKEMLRKKMHWSQLIKLLRNTAQLT